MKVFRLSNATPLNVVFPLLLTSTLSRNLVFGGDLAVVVHYNTIV